MKRSLEGKELLSSLLDHETGPKFSFFFSRRFKPFHFSLSDADC